MKLILVLDDALVKKMEEQIAGAQRKANTMLPIQSIMWLATRKDDAYLWGFEEGKVAAMTQLLNYLKEEMTKAVSELQCAKCGQSFDIDGETFLRAQKSGSGRAIRALKRKPTTEQKTNSGAP